MTWKKYFKSSCLRELKIKWYKHQKIKKFTLNSLLQAYQILTNNDQMIIFCLSYFITTVPRDPCLIIMYFSFLTKRILKDPIKVCLLSEPWSKPKTVSQHSELICRTVVPSHVISKKKRRDRIGHKYLPRIEPALIYCFLRANIRNNLCTVFSVI